MESHTQSATLAGGCFWCLEAAYQMVAGVTAVVSGYAGGTESDATYERVSSGRTGHAEAVQVDFDPSALSFDEILDIFWTIHDPTTRDRQGADVGPQYRSVIFYANEEQHCQAVASKERAQTLWEDPIVTEIVPLEAFYPAEEYHQRYYRANPTQPYCQVVINPKLAKLRERFAERIRD
jgi:peptide-methionine (S)-S-oxide reductase